MKEGYGVYIFATGDIYDGHWSKDERCGYGKYNWVSGECYEGNWLHDKMEG